MQARDGADLVDAVIDPTTKTLRLGSCRLHFFLIPAKTCRISALPLRGFQMWKYGSIPQKLRRRREEICPARPAVVLLQTDAWRWAWPACAR